MRRVPAAALVFAATSLVFAQAGGSSAFLSWTAREAESVGAAMHQTGRVGRFLDVRLLKTDRAYNYKLAATWLTPDVIKATARLQQLARRISDDETRELVRTALTPGEMVVLVEIDPREGSGVIPLDWIALLEPRIDDKQPLPTIAGKLLADRRADPMTAGVLRRNYDYDRFWVSFPLVKDGRPTVPAEANAVDLVVRIYDKEGRVSWPLTPALRTWLNGGSSQH